MAFEALLGKAPARETLLRAVERLEAVLAVPAPTDAWLREARAALRGAVVAVEARLQAFDAAGGLTEEIAWQEPRLLPALERLEADLARLLLDSWEATAMPATQQTMFAVHLGTLAAELRRSADEEFALLAEAEQAPGGEE